jgi:glycosyltransferase
MKKIKRILNMLSDKTYLKIMYFYHMKKRLNFENVTTFNEKLQWLKLHDRKEIYTTMVDKYEVKKYVADLIGGEYVVPTYGIYESYNEIDFDVLPNQFVLKVTHYGGSRGVFIIKDKNTINYSNIENEIEKLLKENLYNYSREWPYKNVKPRIIIEKYMKNEDEEELKDYKLFCFNGKPKIILVCSERFSSSNMCETWFDEDWNLMDIIEGNHRVDKNIKPPQSFKKMKYLASQLSKNIPFVRIDFYEVNSKIYFGEMTFFPASGFEKFEPKEWDKKLGEMIDLEKIKEGENEK